MERVQEQGATPTTNRVVVTLNVDAESFERLDKDALFRRLDAEVQRTLKQEGRRR